MSKVIIAVEWLLSKLYNYFTFIEYHKNVRVTINSAAFLNNNHTCLYNSEVSKYIKLKPQTIEEYL